MENLLAKKLRLGNIVRSKVNGISKVEQIGSSINSEYVGGRSLEGNYWENSYLPIEMTDEWAVKFGYECMVEMACDFSSESKYRIEITSKDLETMKVNEAQNLFFALTGRDLEFETVCECKYPIIRQDLTEYCSICQKEVK